MRIDLHCDSLTAGNGFTGQVKISELLAEKAFQCFAAFTENDEAAVYAAAVKLFRSVFTERNGFFVVKRFGDVETAVKSGLCPCALTCENIGFTGGSYKNILRLKRDGAIMASLVWNFENSLAFPNVRPDGRREDRGLKERGFAALEALDSLKIIADVSHLSDGGVAQILKNRKIPVVASHSGCDDVCKNARNLTDGQLKKIADCGGVAGINFYSKFLGGDGGFAAVAAQIRHILKVAGEDVAAFGGDWDGAPAGGVKILPGDMGGLYLFLEDGGIPPRVLDKIFCGNFLRVLKQTSS